MALELSVEKVVILLLFDNMKFKDYCILFFYVHQTYENISLTDVPTVRKRTETNPEVDTRNFYSKAQRESEQYAFAYKTWQNFVESQPVKNYTVHYCVNSL